MTHRDAMDTPVAALVLAAGRSKRFGSDKRRAKLSGDLTLLEQSLRVFDAADIPIFLCLSSRHQDDDLEQSLAASHRHVIRCDQSESGMGATLAQGIKKIPGHFSVLVALGDMPFLLSATVRRLVAASRNERIVFPTYRGRRGHPVLFGPSFRAELEALDGDEGAASVLKSHADFCVAIPVDDPGVLTDIDTPESMKKVISTTAVD